METVMKPNFFETTINSGFHTDAPMDGRFLWVVYKRYETGKIERVAAFMSEKRARERAAELVGKDGALIGLETIPVEDTPMQASSPAEASLKAIVTSWEAAREGRYSDAIAAVPQYVSKNWGASYAEHARRTLARDQ